MSEPRLPEAPADVLELARGKKIERMGPSERARLLKQVEEYQQEIERQTKEARRADPFWFYTPSSGDIGADRREFLLRHLKPDDVPARCPGQIDVHRSLATVRGASGGNRSGKTTLCCIEAFITATGEVPQSLRGVIPQTRVPGADDGPQHVRVTGKDWENGILGTVLPEYQFWAPREYLVNGDWTKSYSAEKSTLHLMKHGRLKGTIEFMSNAQPVTAFQGPTKHKQIYDEEPRQDIYKENLMRFGTTRQIDVLFGMTPTEGLTWVYDLVNRGKDAADNVVDWFKLPAVTNALVNINVLEQGAAFLTYEEKLMKWLGEFVSLSGLVYGRLFNRKVHVVPAFDVGCTCKTTSDIHTEKCPWEQYYVVKGMDPHLVTETAVVWVALDRWGNKFVVKCRFKEADTELVKEAIANIERENAWRMGWAAVDPAVDFEIKAAGGLNILKKLRTGINKIRRLRLATKGAGSIKTGVDEMKEALRPHPISRRPTLYIMDTPENAPLIKAFETMERDRGVQEDKKGMRDKILESKHHLHAALRYVFMQALRWKASFEAPVPGDPEFAEEDLFG